MAAQLCCLAKVSGLPDFSHWSPPGGGDVRGPCPSLNSLANHGILPHNGKGITIPILAKALGEGLNIGIDFTLLAGGLAILGADDPLGLSFNLDDLNHHERMIEHDASLSRQDAHFGDNHSFNETIWDETLAHFKDSESVSIEAAAKARWHRIVTEKNRDPEFTYNAKDAVLSYAETALYLIILKNSDTGKTPVDWVKTFFEEERFPFNEGWRPPKIPTTMATLKAMTALLNAASGETLPEGVTLTENTLKKVFSGEPLEGVVRELPNVVDLPALKNLLDLGNLPGSEHFPKLE